MNSESEKALHLAARLIVREEDVRLDDAMLTFRDILSQQLLMLAEGNQCRAARWAGVHRNTFARYVAQAHTRALEKALGKPKHGDGAKRAA